MKSRPIVEGVLLSVLAISMPTCAVPTVELEGTDVRVVDEDGHPIAGAWVGSFRNAGGMTDLDLGEIKRWIESEEDSAPDLRSRWSMTDEEGRAKALPVWLLNDVVALTKTLGGRVVVARGSTAQIDIVVREHRFWRVQVVDPQGLDPEDPPTVLFGSSGGVTSDDHSDDFTAVQATGPDGIASFGPLDLFVDLDRGAPVLVAVLDMFTLMPPRVRLRPSEIDDRPTRLVVPAHGRLEIKVSREGRLVRDRVEVIVTKADFHQLNLPGPHFPYERRLDVVDGSASVGRIGLGTNFEVKLDVPRGRGSREIFPGLTDEGEVREIELEAPADLYRVLSLHGQAVDVSERPLSDHVIRIRLCDSETGGWVGGCDTTTDESGKFQGTLRLDSSIATADIILLGCGSVGSLGPQLHAASRAAEFAIDKARDLGRVVLEPLPLLASGRAIDEKNQPIPCMEVELRSLESGNDDNPKWWKAGRFHPSAFTDSRGNFEIRGFESSTGFTMNSWGPMVWSNVEERIKSGTRDITIRRDSGLSDECPSGRIVGRLLLDPEAPRVVVWTELIDPDTQEFRQSLGDAGLSGGFQANSIPVGTWDVRAVLYSPLGRPNEELVRIEDISVARGETTILPDIDLRGRIEVAHVQFVDLAGDPVPTGHVICREGRGEKEPPDLDRFRDGWYVFCGTGDWPEFEILGHKCRREFLSIDEPGDHRVVLRPEFKVRFALPDGIVRPPKPLRLTVFLETDEVIDRVFFLHGGEPSSGDRVEFGADNWVDLHLPALANYRFGLCVDHTRTWTNADGARTARTSSVLIDLIDEEFTMTEDKDGETIVLPITSDMVEKAVRELGF